MVRAAALIGAALALAGCERMEVERAVKATLRDPSSAQFSNVSRCGESDVWSGEVNAKNAYGAYAGPERFVYRSGVALLTPAPWVEPTEEKRLEIVAFREALEACLNAVKAGAFAPSPVR